MPFSVKGVVFFTFVLFRVWAWHLYVGGKNLKQGYMVEVISALALIVSVVKIILMWLNYRDCKKDQKNTDCDK